MADPMTSLVERLEKPGPDLWSLPLVHYSREPLESVYSVEQEPHADQKPRGLWLSVEDGEGWRDWCRMEGFNLRGLAHAANVTLAADANILWLRAARDIDRFTTVYKKPYHSIRDYRMINWAAVAEKYQGIIIAPYNWSRRLSESARWYYSWDCSSGCIWDATAISSLRARQQGEG